METDNRGRVVITLDAASRGELTTNEINSLSCAIYTAGPDSIFGTADDEKVRAPVRWIASRAQIVMTADIRADRQYRIRLVSSRIRTPDGGRLDGEFFGTFPTGNGIAGGDFNAVSKRNTSATVARFYYGSDFLDAELSNNTGVANTVANFKRYADSLQAGRTYDNTIIHRSEPGFVIQGGGFFEPVGSALPSNVSTYAPINLELGLSNVQYTIAMARTSALNSATSQFFFNTVDNVALDTAGGGYAVFGILKSGRSRDLMNRIAGYSTVNLEPGAPPGTSAFTTVPKDDGGNFVTFTRVAILHRLVTLELT
jgi:cyclophilin family peptidyl-prolyl cis-trans isomerase